MEVGRVFIRCRHCGEVWPEASPRGIMLIKKHAAELALTYRNPFTAQAEIPRLFHRVAEKPGAIVPST